MWEQAIEYDDIRYTLSKEYADIELTSNDFWWGSLERKEALLTS